MGLHGISHREIERKGIPGDIDVAVGVQGHAIGAIAHEDLDVLAAAPEVGRPDQGGAVRVEFGDEGFVTVVIQSRLIRILLREIFGLRPADDIRVTIGVAHDVVSAVVVVASQVARIINNSWIDHERTRPIILSESEARAVAVHVEAAGDQLLAAIELLVDEWLALSQLSAAGRVHY